jgi:catechol 2,3-dioxygenase-like lactoylglutathione lyase family enzyme
MSWSQDHVHLRCSDYEAAVRFFVENLDAKEEGRVHNPDGSVTVSLRIGGCPYKVSPVKANAPAGVAHYHLYHLGFETEDLPAQLAKMKARGVKVAQDLVKTAARPYAFVEGPDGIQIELLQKGK